MHKRPELDISEVASAIRRLWDTAEIRPERGLERVEVRDGDLYVEHWSSVGTLHQVTIRAEDVLVIDARHLGFRAIGDPNEAVAAWLETMIQEEIDTGPSSPQSFTFIPN